MSDEPTTEELAKWHEIRQRPETAQRLRSLEAERDRLKKESRRLEDEALESGDFTRCDRCQRVVWGGNGRQYDATPEGYLFQCDECAEAAQAASEE